MFSGNMGVTNTPHTVEPPNKGRIGTRLQKYKSIVGMQKQAFGTADLGQQKVSFEFYCVQFIWSVLYQRLINVPPTLS